jgi:hypothetical protein
MHPRIGFIGNQDAVKNSALEILSLVFFDNFNPRNETLIMNGLSKAFMCTGLASFLLTIPLLAGNIYAAETYGVNPLQFYTGERGSYLKATLEVGLAVFDQSNSCFGNSKEYLGKESNSWEESIMRPGIEGKYTFADYEKIYGRFDVVQANTFGGVDAGGTNAKLGSVSNLHREDTYVGWRSGTLFSSLDEDFLDISFGRQSYVVGNGFLFRTEGGVGYDRAAYWIGMRRDADYAGIVRMRQGGWSIDLLYLRADDIAQSNTRAGGITIDYAFKKIWNIGGGIYSVNTDKPRPGSREDLTAYDIRGSVKPFAKSDSLAALRPLKLEAEFVYEDKPAGNAAGNGWYLAAGYQFDQIPWKPKLTYRYASFEDHYDQLFYGMTEWEYWYQGEIMGEYVHGNHNLDTNMIQLKVQPMERVAVSLNYLHYNFDDAKAAHVTSNNFTDEVDMIMDLTVNKHLSFSLVGAEAVPNPGGTQLLGGKENWLYVMLFSRVKF